MADKATSGKAASAASKTLANPGADANAKTAAASALAQVEPEAPEPTVEELAETWVRNLMRKQGNDMHPTGDTMDLGEKGTLYATFTRSTGIVDYVEAKKAEPKRIVNIGGQD